MVAPNPTSITNIKIPQSEFLDPLTKRPAREWLFWLQNPDVVSVNINALLEAGFINIASYLMVGTYIEAGEYITAGTNLNAGIDVNAGNNVNAENNINAVVDVNAGNNVNASNDVNSIRDVNAGRNVNVVGYVAAPTYVDFNTASTIPTHQFGRLYWNNDAGNQTLNLCMAGSSVIQQIGEKIYYRVKASSAIVKGQVVMFTGTLGAFGILTAAPATGLTAETASYVMGIAAENILINEFGYVTQFGLVSGIDTTGGAETWVDGQILYLNPAVAGGLTKTAPTASNPKVQVCAVVKASSGTSGSLFVRPTYGGKLGQFEGDVQITTPAAGQVLMYDGTKWENISATNGQLLIGNGTGFTKATLTEGANIDITNGSGAITIATKGAFGSFTTVDLKTVTVTDGIITSIA